MKNKLKKLITLFLPPVLNNLGRGFLKQIRLLTRPAITPTHEVEIVQRIYASYEEAEKDFTRDAYQNIELCNMVAEKTAIANKKTYGINSTNVFLLAALNYVIAKRSLKSIVVLDFGGACGAHYFEMRRFLNKPLEVKWIVVETPQMVKSAISHGLSNNELTFTESINSIPFPVDLVYSSGALQSVPKPVEFLNLLLKVNAPFLLFNRMMLNENEDEIIVVQQSWLSENGPLPSGYEDKRIYYPHTTMPWSLFNNIVLSYNYILEWDFTEKSGSLPGRDQIKGCGLFYSKK